MGWQRQEKKSLVVFDSFCPHRAYYEKVKIEANKLFCLLYSKLATLDNL